jgi:hypothetical protein
MAANVNKQELAKSDGALVLGFRSNRQVPFGAILEIETDTQLEGLLVLGMVDI